MLLDIPDLQGHEKETLYIIGNGFDRAHNLKTSYSNFHDWLMIDHQDFVEIMESIFDGRDKSRFADEEVRPSLLWTDFEAALGKINADTAREFLMERYGNLDTDTDALEQAVKEIERTVNNVNDLILEWSRNTSVNFTHRLFNMSNDSKYLTFNYTLTLEEGYNIKEQQILHIHSNVNDGKVIVGCERDVNRLPDNIDRGRRRYSKRVNEQMNKFNKPVDDLIDKYDEFFQSLASVSRVVVIGHSLTEIDMPYISEVLQHVNTEAHWHFSSFNDNDHKNIENFIDVHMNNQHKNIYIFNVRLMIEDKDKPIESKAQPAPEPRPVRLKNKRNQLRY